MNHTQQAGELAALPADLEAPGTAFRDHTPSAAPRRDRPVIAIAATLHKGRRENGHAHGPAPRRFTVMITDTVLFSYVHPRAYHRRYG